MNFKIIKDELMKGCGQWWNDDQSRCGYEVEWNEYNEERKEIKTSCDDFLCNVCKAKISQLEQCEQMVRDAVKKIDKELSINSTRKRDDWEHGYDDCAEDIKELLNKELGLDNSPPSIDGRNQVINKSLNVGKSPVSGVSEAKPTTSVGEINSICKCGHFKSRHLHWEGEKRTDIGGCYAEGKYCKCEKFEPQEDKK